MKILTALGQRLIREPVLLFAAIGASIYVWAPQVVDTELEKAAVAAILVYLQRTFSTSKANFDEKVAEAKDIARDRALADVASLKPKPAPRARKAAAK